MVFVLNTLGNSNEALKTRRGYGHYLAVRLEILNDGIILVTYADSLESGNIDSHKELLTQLVKDVVKSTNDDMEIS